MTRCGHTRAAGSQIGHGKGSRGRRTPLDTVPTTHRAKPHGRTLAIKKVWLSEHHYGSDYVPGLLGSFRSVHLSTVWAPPRLRKACSFSVSRSRTPPAVADTRIRCASCLFTSAILSSLLKSRPAAFKFCQVASKAAVNGPVPLAEKRARIVGKASLNSAAHDRREF